jgi:hypothetical protein
MFEAKAESNNTTSQDESERCDYTPSTVAFSLLKKRQSAQVCCHPSLFIYITSKP